MAKVKRSLLGCAVAVLALGATFWVLLGGGQSEPTAPAAAGTVLSDSETEPLDALVAVIAAHSQGTEPPLAVRAPPSRSQPIPSAATAPAQAPDGYSYPAFRSAGKALSAEDGPPREALPTGPEWLGSPAGLSALRAQAGSAGRDWSFGWVRLREDMPADLTAQALAALGVVVEGRAGPLLRARLPSDPRRLGAIAALPGVEGLGAPPPSAKLPAPFAIEAAAQPANEVVPVFVTLAAAGDADGRWGRELERLGAVVGPWDPDTRAYVANVAYGLLDAVAAADFVAFVEPVGIVEAIHDTAVPAMGADAYRSHAQGTGFQGTAGAAAAIGVMDTGLNVNHVDIESGRSSVCAANFVPSLAEEQDLLWDANGHGTHVTATIAGNGAGELQYAGMAPLARHIRFAKVLSSQGWGYSSYIFGGMDFLARPSSCEAAGWTDDAVTPMIVNMSLSSTSLLWHGRHTPARKLDAVVWGARQLYVVANSNSSVHGFSSYGAAKSSLPVGATYDSGELAYFSSYGPTADGRLAPLVVGTGVSLRSAAGAGSRSGYRGLSGTSMSSPSVAGVAALAMDAQPDMRWNPALARAHLMASAIKPDAWLGAAAAFPADNTGGPGALQVRYGLGKVSGTTAVLNRAGDDGWQSGGWHGLRPAADEYHEFDLDVPEGASRLDVVLTWDEPPADVVANTVLNDLDLWLDAEGDCERARCGERSSRSRRDNVEWVIVQNPRPGLWRAKVVAERVYGQRPRAALAYTVIRGPATPQLTVEAERDTLGPDGRVKLRVSADGYVAAGTRLGVDCRSADGAPCDWEGSYAPVSDGAVGRSDTIVPRKFISLGEIRPEDPRTLRFEFRREFMEAGDGLHFTVTGWNAAGASAVVFAEEVAADSVVRPGNDDFAAAAEIGEDAAAGDLLLATTESGEPAFEIGLERPAASVWYRWKAPLDGPVHFALTTDEVFQGGRIWRNGFLITDFGMRVDVFEGRSIAGARRVAGAQRGASFIAEAGVEYAIRVAGDGRAAPFRLRWRMGPAPDNDAFHAPVALEGDKGRITGSNAGATLEFGEYFGGLAATVWYEWTAPADGWQQFRSLPRQTRVVAFQDSDTVSLARLVSGRAQERAHFPVRAGDVYRIAVASADAEVGGTEFELTWTPVEENWSAPENDSLAEATPLPDAAESHASVFLDRDATVEPGEPTESGVRTAWWSWTAPASGAYTWRLKSDRVRLSGFAGDALENLEFIGANTGATGEFSFLASEGQPYRFASAAGSGVHAFTTAWVRRTLDWGPTPQNDAWSGAVSLGGPAGTLQTSNRFATAATGERIRDVGHSSLWWSFEAPAAGWYRFWIETEGPFTLAGYRVDDPDVPAGRLELLASSVRGLANGVELFLYAGAEGERFAVRAGTRGDADGRKFTLQWGPSHAPVWLRYAGRTADRQVWDMDGVRTEVEDLGVMAFDDAGRTLYAASSAGVAVFERAAEDGALELVGLWPRTADDTITHLYRDAPRGRLLAFAGCAVRAYTPTDDGRTLARDEAVTVTGGSPCMGGSGRVFVDPSGLFLHVLSPSGLQVFSFGEDGALTLVETTIDSFADAAPYGDKYVLGVWYGRLSVWERDASGVLEEVHSEQFPFARSTIAVREEDSLAFLWGDRGVGILDLADPTRPVVLDALDDLPGEDPWNSFRCRFSATRLGRPAAEAFCGNGGAYALAWRNGALALTDVLAGWFPNRHNDVVPGFRELTGFAASPDGRHAYVSTANYDVLVFERVGNDGSSGDAESGPTATLVGDLPWSGDGYIQVGGERDRFQIDLSEPGVLTAHTTGGTDTYGTLLDSDKRVRTEDDDSGSNYNFRFEAAVEAGTWQVEVRGYSHETAGPYRLHIEFAPDG